MLFVCARGEILRKFRVSRIHLLKRMTEELSEIQTLRDRVNKPPLMAQFEQPSAAVYGLTSRKVRDEQRAAEAQS